MDAHHSYITNDASEFAKRFGAGLADFAFESGIVGGNQPSTYAGSPKMWNAYWNAVGASAIFLAYDVPEDSGHASFNSFLESALKSPRVIELTVTDPFKASAYRFLEERGRLDESARRIGNVNTIVKSGGVPVGYNTDWIGVKYSLQDEAELDGATVLLDGAGGAGTAAGHAIADLIGSGTLYLYNRTVTRNGKFVSGGLADELERYTKAKVVPLGIGKGKEKLDERDKEEMLADILPLLDMYANATTVPVPLTRRMLDALPDGALVFDVKYADKHVAEWKRTVEGSGRRFISGLGMLYYQFVDAVQKIDLGNASSRRKALLAAADAVGYSPRFAGVRL